MLVFISDLHFVDGTAGDHNLPTEAFEKFFAKLEIDADHTKNPKEVKIILLGDIFDLLRTEAWFQEEVKDRPWGEQTEKMRERAGKILDRIRSKNSPTFKLFKQVVRREKYFERIENIQDVEFLYIPGNHDRLCWTIDDLKNRVIEILGLKANNPENFKPEFSNFEYGVYAMHGHPFDQFNYEGSEIRTDEDYKLMPIGDPITTELVTRLPYSLMEKVKEEHDFKDIQKTLKRNFQEIDNVRPFSATLKWLFYEVETNRELRAAMMDSAHMQKKLKNIIEETVDEVIQGFQELSFVQEWYTHHDLPYALDVADKIQLFLLFLQTGQVFSFESLFNLADKVKAVREVFSEDSLVQGAAELFSNLDRKIQYIVMGHTHVPMKKAIGLGPRYESVYLNTGTWRKRYHECLTGKGFIAWKDLNYVTVYTPEEKPNRDNLPVFETWSGSLKTEKMEEQK